MKVSETTISVNTVLIKERMDMFGYNISSLSRKVGHDRAVLSTIISGKRGMGVHLMFALCEVLVLNPRDMFFIRPTAENKSQ